MISEKLPKILKLEIKSKFYTFKNEDETSSKLVLQGNLEFMKISEFQDELEECGYEISRVARIY